MEKKKVLIALLLLSVIILSGCTAHSLDTKKKTGGVIICGEDFPCGNLDEICPEDYGADCKVKDPDCV